MLQASATVVPMLHLPAAVNTTILRLVVLGFPITLVMAWSFEMTPDGVRRTEPADSPEAQPS